MSYLNEMLETVNAICTNGKGVLAADESTGTIGKRFKQIDVENNEENRSKYRDLLFNTPNLNDHISGVITYEETLRLSNNNGRLVKPLFDQNIVVGIKTDMGVKTLAGTDGETTTQGLDNLDARCQEYYELGARFAKWRNTYKIKANSDGSFYLPSNLAMEENAKVLARYASVSQQNGLVPIVEPEVLMDGNHSIETCAAASEKVLAAVYKALSDYNVVLEATLLKTNMSNHGADSAVGNGPNHEEIAKYTVRTLQRTVPSAVPGIVFLSGGMSEEDASLALNEINKLAKKNGKCPWYLSFSYGRALQHSVLQAWKGSDENIKSAQNVLQQRAEANGHATIGEYNNSTHEDVKASQQNLHQKNYTY